MGHLLLPSQSVSKKLDWKLSSWDMNWRFDMGHQFHREWVLKTRPLNVYNSESDGVT